MPRRYSESLAPDTAARAPDLRRRLQPAAAVGAILMRRHRREVVELTAGCGAAPSAAARSLACGGSRRRRWHPSVRRVRRIRLDREAPVPLDSRLVLSLQGQSKVRLLVQPGPPTQRAGSRPAARVRAGPWPSGHPRAAARCPENRPSTEPEGGSGCGDHPARVLVRQPNHRRPVTFPPK